MNFQLTAAAESDIEKIKSDYAGISSKLVDEFLDEFEFLCTVIESFPKSGIPYRRIYKQYAMKRFPYLVMCEVRKSSIIIHGIVHAKRHPKHRIRRIK